LYFLFFEFLAAAPFFIQTVLNTENGEEGHLSYLFFHF
jgi:hypothetical protein